MNEEEFPLKHYIVDAEQETRIPDYLLKDLDYTEFVMKPNFILPMLEPANWPSAEMLDLDPSQYRAFKYALTNEFSVIQGRNQTIYNLKTTCKLKLLLNLLALGIKLWQLFFPSHLNDDTTNKNVC